MNQNNDQQLATIQAINDVQRDTSLSQRIRRQQEIRLLKAERYSTTRLWYKHTHRLV